MATQTEPVRVSNFKSSRTLGRLEAAVRPLGVFGVVLGVAALAAMVFVSLELVGAAATAHSKLLVPSGHRHYPPWMHGPFRGYRGALSVAALERLLIALGVLYLVLLACSRALPAWLAFTGVAILTAVFALAPPLFSTDIFNYVNYARLGVIHHVNPYVHGASAFPHDSSYRFTGHKWINTPTAYGPVFTLLSYAFAGLGVGGAMWALKAVSALAALGTSAFIWASARRLGIRPATAMLFFALNPLVLVYAVGGGHNDVLMMLPLAAGVFLLLDGQPAAGGAAIVVAAAIKLTAGLALPFVLIASPKRWRVLAGAAGAAAVIGAVALAVFGVHLTGMLDVLRNHDKLTATITSVPGYIGHLLGFGGLTPARRVIFQVLFGLGAAGLLFYAWRTKDWLAGAAAALVLLVATMGWLLPWYAVWALGLPALVRKRWVPAAALALTAIVMAIQIHLYDRHFSPVNAIGQKAPGRVQPGAVAARPALARGPDAR